MVNNPNRCGNCRYWGQGNYEVSRRNKIPLSSVKGPGKTCGAVPHDDNRLSDCETDMDHDDLTDYDMVRLEERDSMFKEFSAVSMDGSGYFSALVTTADFGCVLHEPRLAIAQTEREVA